MDIGIISDSIDEYSGGIGVYTYQILKNFYQMDIENRYHLIHYSKSDIELYNKNNEILIPKNRFMQGRGSYLFWRYITLPQKLKKHPLDVVHDTYELGPFIFSQPFRKVITIHDLTPLLFPNIFKWGDVKLHQLLLKRTINQADKIITVSYNTQKDLMEYLDVPKGKIKVIYNGIDESFKTLTSEEIMGVKERYGLPKQFILSVGGLHPIKNIPRLLKAFYLARKDGLKHKLVIVGGIIDKTDDIFLTIKDLRLQDNIIFTGIIPHADLVAIYNAAELFIYPALYAGFGFPPLEAMSCGTPVITSSTSSLPEITGDAAILINPYNTNEIAKTIMGLLSNKEMMEILIEKGLKRIKMFNWEKTTHETIKVYNEVYNY